MLRVLVVIVNNQTLEAAIWVFVCVALTFELSWALGLLNSRLIFSDSVESLEPLS